MMRCALALLALAASAAAQAVTSLIIPSGTPPAGCENSRAGTFELEIVSANGSASAASSGASAAASTLAASTAHRRSYMLGSRQTPGDLSLSLTGGILTDSFGRRGYIASNYQFQFDHPPQAGAIYTAGWTICPNGSIALGGQALFWQCKSGSFYNLYDRDWAPAHCYPVYFLALEGAGALYSTAPPGPESTGSDQATIKNGGGTQSMNNTSSNAPTQGITLGAASSSSSGPTTTGGSSSGKGSTSTSSGGAAALALATDVPQAFIAWAVGLVGAFVLV